MALPSERVAPPRGTRPPNRRQLIITAAADLFSRNGYPHVAMTDIARAVAIGPSALYRHFRGKQDLLAEVVHEAFAATAAALSAVDNCDRSAVLRALAGVALRHRGLGALWQRESRHLEPSRREPLRAELVEIGCAVAAVVRPGGSDAEAELLTWAVLGALMSVSFQRIELPEAEYHDLLTELAGEIADTRLPPLGEGSIERGPVEKGQSKREELLAAAVDLFAERGYRTVGIEDIGAAVGMAGPSVYHHFASKVDILLAAMANGAGQLQDGMAEVLSGERGEAATVRALLRSYVDYSLRHSAVMDLLITETAHLPVPEREQVHQLQRAYLAEWHRLLQSIHSGLSYGHVRVRLQAVLSVINDVARTPYLRTQPGIEDALCAIGCSILRLPDR